MLLDKNVKSMSQVEGRPREKSGTTLKSSHEFCQACATINVDDHTKPKAKKVDTRTRYRRLLVLVVQSNCKRRASNSDDMLDDGRPRSSTRPSLYRRYAADKTALLLSRDVLQHLRCLAFCKTRGLVEWVYDKAIQLLKSDPSTDHLCNTMESYRRGYSRTERQQIEEELVSNKLPAVVWVSASELGVDVGGVDLTLHCGFPASHASLLQ